MSPAVFIASGGGAGYARWAPGTAGSVVGMVIGVLLLGLGHGVLLAGVVVSGVGGVVAVWLAGVGGDDPGWVVIDEVSGQLVAMMVLPRVSLVGVILAFGLFRLFDVVKPGWVGLADARHDAVGVMADDWIAGFFAAVVLWVILRLFPGLGW